MGQQVEGDEGRGRRLRQLADALLGGMDALGEGVEVEPAGPGDDDLAVQHAARRELASQRLDELGEVAGERLLVAAAEGDVVAVAEDDAAEAVPLGLVEEPRLARQLAGELGQHGCDGRTDGAGSRRRLVRGGPGEEPVHRLAVDDALERHIGGDGVAAAAAEPAELTRRVGVGVDGEGAPEADG